MISLSTLTTASSADLLAMVKRRHPDYAANLAHWLFLESCYKGGREWIDENIFTYHKEGKIEFKKRKERAYRFPHSREVISLVNKYIFKGAIERAEDSELPIDIKNFWKSSTTLRRPIADLMNSISTWTSTFGRIWVVVDNNVPAGVVSEADRKNSGGRCYSYFLKPTDVLDLAYADDGELAWVIVQEYTRDDANPLTAGDVKMQYRVWTPNFNIPVIVAKRTDGTEFATVGKPTEYNLGIVPIFPADHINSDELYKTHGLIEDVAYLDRAVANYLSNLDVIIQDQTFSQLAIPFQGLLPSEGQDDDPEVEEQRHIMQMGTKRVFAYNAEGGAAPEFISPDVKQATLIMDVITKIVGEIYHSIGMAGERTKQDNSAGIDNSSGVAKAYDFEKLNAMLAAKARSLQGIECNLVRIVNAWHHKLEDIADVTDYVTYPTTFDVRNLVDEMDNAQRLAVMQGPKILRREQMERVAHKMFPQMPATEMKEIIDDIENDWLEDPLLDLASGMPTIRGMTGTPAAPTSSSPAKPVPGKKNRQGENNKPAPKSTV